MSEQFTLTPAQGQRVAVAFMRDGVPDIREFPVEAFAVGTEAGVEYALVRYYDKVYQVDGLEERLWQEGNAILGTMLLEPGEELTPEKIARTTRFAGALVNFLAMECSKVIH
jgi:hypothetical protein